MSEIRYKLTRKDRCTHAGFQWPEPGGGWVETLGEGSLCTSGWIHWYSDPALALFLNPIHACIPPEMVVVWRGEVEGACLTDRGIKEGWTRGRLLEMVDQPSPTIEQHVRFGILCSIHRFRAQAYLTWAERWLDETDRSSPPPWSAMEWRVGEKFAPKAAARSAARAATCKILREAAWWAAWAANEEAWVGKRPPPLDLIALAHKAMAA